MSVDEKKIAQIYGYMPKFDERFVNYVLECVENDDTAQVDLVSIIDEMVGEDKERTIVVPLSGGLDSRLILAALLSSKHKYNVRAITFGEPGLWDTQFARDFAKSVSVPWEFIDLRDDIWDLKILQNLYEDGEGPVWFVDRYLNQLARMRYEGAIVFSGFMGDPLAGSHLAKSPSGTVREAIALFDKRNRLQTEDGLMLKFDWATIDSCVTRAHGYLTIDEVLDFGIRQASLIRPIVAPEAADYVKCPFLHPSWVKFCLSQPYKARLNCAWYWAYAFKNFPILKNCPFKQDKNGEKSTLSGNIHRIRRALSRKSGRDFFDQNQNYLQLNSSIENYPHLRRFIGANSRGSVLDTTMEYSRKLLCR